MTFSAQSFHQSNDVQLKKNLHVFTTAETVLNKLVLNKLCKVL